MPCTNCKSIEKKYLKSEAKYLKAIDRLQKVQTDLEISQQELQEVTT